MFCVGGVQKNEIGQKSGRPEFAICPDIEYLDDYPSGYRRYIDTDDSGGYDIRQPGLSGRIFA